LVLTFREEVPAGANDCPTARRTKKPSQKGAGLCS
jgi:hypothetical protein